MLYTTFALAHKSAACTTSYRKMAKALGGVSHYGKDTPFSLSKVVEILNLDDAIWCLRCTTTPAEAENILIEFACRCAERVLTHYEIRYPTDKRPRSVIETARRCITDKTPAARDAARAAVGDAAGAARAAARAARAAAWAAAWAAAGAAAWDAAGDAAWDAAWDAARAARAAAWDAARDAAWAAWAAAGDAAWDAEREWQTQTFLALLEAA